MCLFCNSGDGLILDKPVNLDLGKTICFGPTFLWVLKQTANLQWLV